MYRICRLGDLMEGSFRASFQRAVELHDADKHVKSFGCWEHFIALACGQLQSVSSLRALESALNALEPYHYHLGIKPVHRSTLADANQRDPAVFGTVVQKLMERVRGAVKRDCQKALTLLDSTSITLKGHGFDAWTASTRNRCTQGLKLHIALDSSNDVPKHQTITAANVNDVTEGWKVPIERGATYVFDKGYCDYAWWWSIKRQGAYFVTRSKINTALLWVKDRPISRAARQVVLADEVVRFKNLNPRGGRKNPYVTELRRVTIVRQDTGKPMVLLTNDMKRSALDIAACYKARWDIELFFKWIKQHLNLKHYLGRSENAVRTQILIALIVYLLVALLKQRLQSAATLWHFLVELRATLFQRPRTDIEMRRRRQQRAAEQLARQPHLFDTY